jgi:hypothetical protein
MRVPAAGGGGGVFCATEAQATASVAESRADLVFMGLFLLRRVGTATPTQTGRA